MDQIQARSLAAQVLQGSLPLTAFKEAVLLQYSLPPLLQSQESAFVFTNMVLADLRADWEAGLKLYSLNSHEAVLDFVSTLAQQVTLHPHWQKHTRQSVTFLLAFLLVRNLISEYIQTKRNFTAAFIAFGVRQDSLEGGGPVDLDPANHEDVASFVLSIIDIISSSSFFPDYFTFRRTNYLCRSYALEQVLHVIWGALKKGLLKFLPIVNRLLEVPFYVSINQPEFESLLSEAQLNEIYFPYYFQSFLLDYQMFRSLGERAVSDQRTFELAVLTISKVTLANSSLFSNSAVGLECKNFHLRLLLGLLSHMTLDLYSSLSGAISSTLILLNNNPNKYLSKEEIQEFVFFLHRTTSEVLKITPLNLLSRESNLVCTAFQLEKLCYLLLAGLLFDEGHFGQMHLRLFECYYYKLLQQPRPQKFTSLRQFLKCLKNSLKPIVATVSRGNSLPVLQLFRLSLPHLEGQKFILGHSLATVLFQQRYTHTIQASTPEYELFDYFIALWGRLSSGTWQRRVLAVGIQNCRVALSFLFNNFSLRLNGLNLQLESSMTYYSHLQCTARLTINDVLSIIIDLCYRCLELQDQELQALALHVCSCLEQELRYKGLYDAQRLQPLRRLGEYLVKSFNLAVCEDKTAIVQFYAILHNIFVLGDSKRLFFYQIVGKIKAQFSIEPTRAIYCLGGLVKNCRDLDKLRAVSDIFAKDLEMTADRVKEGTQSPAGMLTFAACFTDYELQKLAKSASSVFKNLLILAELVFFLLDKETKQSIEENPELLKESYLVLGKLLDGQVVQAFLLLYPGTKIVETLRRHYVQPFVELKEARCNLITALIRHFHQLCDRDKDNLLHMLLMQLLDSRNETNVTALYVQSMKNWLVEALGEEFRVKEVSFWQVVRKMVAELELQPKDHFVELLESLTDALDKYVLIYKSD